MRQRYPSLIDTLFAQQPQQPMAPLRPTQENMQQPQAPGGINYRDLIRFGSALSEAGDQGYGIGKGISLGFQAMDQATAERLKQDLAEREMQLKALELQNLSQHQKDQIAIAREKNALERVALNRGVGQYASNIPSDVRSYQYFSGLTPEQQKQFLNVKRSFLPQGFDLTPGGGVAPLPGLEAGLRGIEGAKAGGSTSGKIAAEKAAGAPKAAATIAGSAATYANVDDLIDAAKEKVGVLTAGPAGAAGKFIPGTEALALDADLEAIKANLGFDQLQTMRDNSPTGGALGQVAVKEMLALQSTMANLNQNLGPNDLKKALDRVKTQRKIAFRNVVNAYKAEYGQDIPMEFIPQDLQGMITGESNKPVVPRNNGNLAPTKLPKGWSVR